MSAKERLLKHALICFGIFLIFTLLSIFSSRVHLGFFGNVALLVVGTIFTTIGVFIGDSFRLFVMPDLISASDSVDMFKKRVFWKIGPQVIGWIVGLIAFKGMMTNVLGIPV